MIRTLLLFTGLLGSLLSGLVLLLSYSNPVMVENMAREMVRQEVEKRVHAKLHTLQDSKIAGLAGQVLARQTAETEKLKLQLAADLPARIASMVADMGKLDCTCRQKIEKSIATGIQEHNQQLAQLNDRLNELIRSKYMEVAQSLTREFRIFTAANTLVFVLLIATVALRPRASVQLLLPAGVLLGAAALTAYFYVFGQDWLHTVIFADYVGLAYFAYLALAIASLADVAFNKARVCTALINAAASAVGSAFQVLPC